MGKTTERIPRSVKNIYHFLRAVAANVYHGFPARKLKVIGVTGTDGKTTTVNLIYHILKIDGKKVSMISTVNAVIGKKEYDTGFHVTTPDPFDVQKYFKQMIDAGSEYAVVETTSHGLDQNRVLGGNFQIGVITNVTHEHLDYHKTYDRYLRAKAKLLRGVKNSVLNGDDESFGKLSLLASGKITNYGLRSEADVKAKNIEYSSDGSDFSYSYLDEGNHRVEMAVKLPLLGEYNVYNALAAISVAKVLGIEDRVIKKALASFKGIIGRMEKIENDRNFNIYVDFAHTPNALEKAIQTIKPITSGRTVVVFGAAGLRDTKKRPLMGKVAGKLADYTVVTAEDPRTEDLNQIMAEISEGIVRSGGVLNKTFWMEGDRQKAINYAIRKLARAGDTIIICGKGHEKSLCVGTEEIPWSDQEAVKKALEEV
ncbi:MAG: UDP-N-acetylmuramoyl-L-alanyl-D-glutamate--2,6-diaminopimelate ligase [Patescibacteria group bacterium]|nr:UDP-N-acetylmuramoyl-L-alanyl-D-glutamate--2,6-diaminopimelate ligase [Patescibacteria group bacterium]